MHINSLSISDFRRFRRLEVDFDDHLTLLYGENAKGKTSILEAVFFLSILTSPLASYDREVINFSCLENEIPVSRIVGSIRRQGHNHRIELRIIFDVNTKRIRKEVLIDGVKRRLFEAVGFFNSVIFLPQMTRIIENGPDEKRRYLDQVLSQTYPGYLKILSNYQKGLAKRNALLKLLSERGGDHDQLDYWDQMIAALGSELMVHRQKAIIEIEVIAQEKFSRLTNNRETFIIRYVPSYCPGEDCPNNRMKNLTGLQSLSDQTAIIEGFLSTLRKTRQVEIKRGITTIGPHRDDIQFFSNNTDLGLYGSRGQIRTAILALKFSEMAWLTEKTGETPVLLLDETLAELDNQRRGDLLKMLTDGHQAILTSAEPELFPASFLEGCRLKEIGESEFI